MNIDANVQKILFALLNRWKLLVVFALIGVTIGYFYTSHFTTLTYSSTVEFFAEAYDARDDMNESSNNSTSSTSENARVSNTSKMTYAMRMLPTYVEIFHTNQFCSKVADALNDEKNSNYGASTIRNAVKYESIEDTPMFTATVTTTDPDLSYDIAKTLQKVIPKQMEKINNGLVRATIQDEAVRASSAGSLGYPQKCAIGGVIGIAVAAAYVILRTLFDVRVKSSDELTDKYNIPVLGSIPDFEARGIQTLSPKKGDYNYSYGTKSKEQSD